MSLSRRELLRRLGALVVVAPFVKPSSIMAAEPTPLPVEIMPPEFSYDLVDIPRVSSVEFNAAPIAEYEPPATISYEVARRIEGKIEAGGVNLAALNIMTSDDPYSWPVLITFKTANVGSPHHALANSSLLLHGFSLESRDYPAL